MGLELGQLTWTARFPLVLYSVVFRIALCNSSRAKGCRDFTVFFFPPFLPFLCPEGAEMFNLYTTGVCFPNSLRTTQTPHLGLEFDGRKQQNPQTLASKSPCVSRRVSKILVSFYFSLGSFSLGDHFLGAS